MEGDERSRCLRGVRGAACAARNEEAAIIEATADLLRTMQEHNGVAVDAIVSAFFTVTSDLDAAYPAEAARQLGWHHVPLLCSQEIPVPGGLERCIRVLLHVYTSLPPTAIHHVYLGEAARLRPDLA